MRAAAWASAHMVRKCLQAARAARKRLAVATSLGIIAGLAGARRSESMAVLSEPSPAPHEQKRRAQQRKKRPQRYPTPDPKRRRRIFEREVMFSGRKWDAH